MIICRTCYWQHLTNAWRYKKEPAGTGKIPFFPSPLAINPTDLPHKYNVPALFLSDKTSPYTTGNILFPLFAQHSLCKIQFFFQTSSFLLQILYSKQYAFDNDILNLSQVGHSSIHSVLHNPILRTISTQNNSMRIHRFLLTGQIHFPIYFPYSHPYSPVRVQTECSLCRKHRADLCLP